MEAGRKSGLRKRPFGLRLTRQGYDGTSGNATPCHQQEAFLPTSILKRVGACSHSLPLTSFFRSPLLHFHPNFLKPLRCGNPAASTSQFRIFAHCAQNSMVYHESLLPRPSRSKSKAAPKTHAQSDTHSNQMNLLAFT